MHRIPALTFIPGLDVPQLPPPLEEELDVSDQTLDPKDNSMLSCQVQLTPKEGGIVVAQPKHTVDLTMKLEPEYGVWVGAALLLSSSSGSYCNTTCLLDQRQSV